MKYKFFSSPIISCGINFRITIFYNQLKNSDEVDTNEITYKNSFIHMHTKNPFETTSSKKLKR